MKNKDLQLTISNIFIKKSEEQDKWPYSSISIPEIKIYSNSKTAFYISKDNKNLTYKKVRNFELKDKNSFLTLYNYNKLIDEADRYDNTNDFTNRKKDLDYISDYFDLLDISDDDDNNIPLVDIWLSCLSVVKNKDKLLKEQKVYEQFAHPLKNLTYGHISDFINHFSELSDNFNGDLSHFFNAAKEAFVKKDKQNKEVQLGNIFFIANEFNKNLFKIFIDLFKVVSKEFIDVLNNVENNALSDKKTKIQESEYKLEFIEKINSTSIAKVENDLKIRDLKFEIAFYKEYKEQLKAYSRKYIFATIKQIKKQINVFEIQSRIAVFKSPEYFDCIKDILIKKQELKLWEQNYWNLRFLKKEDLEHLKSQIESEVNIFINKNFGDIRNKYKNTTVSRIKSFISREFDININRFISKSKSNFEFIKNQISSNKAIIKTIQSKRFNYISSYKNEVMVHDFSQTIQLANAELEWETNTQERLFKNLIKNKDRKLQEFNASYKKIEKMLDKTVSELSAVFKNDNSENLTKVLNSFANIKFLMKSTWVSKMLSDLIDFSKTTTAPKFEFVKDLSAMFKFVETFENSAITHHKYLDKYKTLDTLDKIKLKITKFALDEIKFLFISDDIKTIAPEARNEFYRVLFKFANANNMNIIIITDDLQFIKNSCDYVYFFDDTQVLEWGRVSKVFNKTISPLVKMLIEGKIQSLNSQTNSSYVESFVKRNSFSIDDNLDHYVYCTLKEFQTWTHVIQTVNVESSIDLGETQTHTSLVNPDLVSVFNESQALLTSHGVSVREKKDNPILEDLTLYNELINNKNLASISTTEDDENNEELAFSYDEGTKL
ncbi:MAG1360 family OppF-related protein [Mycoplasma sp. 2248]|uniref:MAG1360 family OppF-related protein n=1 Tax=Mycoplasma sp. 2248 TaxID=3108528 RepID=UPI002B1E2BDF|nr:hypothetical protein [Mycoplasma sp. 2248]MEA4191043.1 hypothetical protein [Mycoplasma sp. 2248]